MIVRFVLELFLLGIGLTLSIMNECWFTTWFLILLLILNIINLCDYHDNYAKKV